VSRKWSDCHKGTEMRVKALMAAMKELGYPMFVVFTYRTLEQQMELYNQGRTTPGKIVTWTKRGWHNLTESGAPCARAVDLAFSKQDRFPGRDEWSLSWPWGRLHKIAKALELSVPLARDKGHIVDMQGETFNQAWNKRS